MASEIRPSTLDFGAAVAFVAPGLFAFSAVSYHLPSARVWLAAAAEMDQSVGVFLFTLLASLALGLVVSGIRSLLVDNVLCWKGLGQFAVPRLNLNWGAVDETNLPVLLTVRDNFYRYYQFYSNTFVALFLWSIARCLSTSPRLGIGMIVMFAIGLPVLFLSARQSLIRYVSAVQQILTKPGRLDEQRIRQEVHQ